MIILYLPSAIVFFVWKERGKYKIIYCGTYVIISCATIIGILNSDTNYINKIRNINAIENRAIERKKIINNENTKICIGQLEEKEYKEETHIDIINKDERSEYINNSIYSIEQNYEEEIKKQQELIDKFKNELYSIEKKALIPLRNSYDILKKIKTGKANIKELYKEVYKAKVECEIVEKLYANLIVPNDIYEENRKLLYYAKADIQKSYYLRGKAMANGLKFLDSKNPKYIMKCKEELKTADEFIYSCVQKLNKVKSKVDE